MPRKKQGGGATKKDPTKSQVYTQMMQLLEQREWKQALPMTVRALKKMPAGVENKRLRAECYNIRAGCFAQLDDYPEMLKAAKAATVEDKTYGVAWFRAGAARSHLEQYAEAVLHLGQALPLGGLDANNESRANSCLPYSKNQLAAAKDAPASGSAPGIPDGQRKQAAAEPEPAQPATAGPVEVQRKQAAPLAFEKVEPTDLPEEPEGGWASLPAFLVMCQLSEQLATDSVKCIEQSKVALTQMPKSDKKGRAICYITQSACFGELGKQHYQHKAAVAATEEAPTLPQAWDACGNPLQILGRCLEAVYSYEMALQLGIGAAGAEAEARTRGHLQEVQLKDDRKREASNPLT